MAWMGICLRNGKGKSWRRQPTLRNWDPALVREGRFDLKTETLAISQMETVARLRLLVCIPTFPKMKSELDGEARNSGLQGPAAGIQKPSEPDSPCLKKSPDRQAESANFNA